MRLLFKEITVLYEIEDNGRRNWMRLWIKLASIDSINKQKSRPETKYERNI